MTEPRHDADLVPLVCDMSGAPDTLAERLEEYRQLFAASLVSRERTDAGIRFRLHGDAALPARVRDLADREQACCAFFTFVITEQGDEVLWDTSVIDSDAARRILDDFYSLAESDGTTAPGCCGSPGTGTTPGPIGSSPSP